MLLEIWLCFQHSRASAYVSTGKKTVACSTFTGDQSKNDRTYEGSVDRIVCLIGIYAEIVSGIVTQQYSICVGIH